MPAAFLVRAVIKFHIEQGVGLQAFLCCNLIVLCFPLPKCAGGGFLCCLDNLRVILDLCQYFRQKKSKDYAAFL